MPAAFDNRSAAASSSAAPTFAFATDVRPWRWGSYLLFTNAVAGGIVGAVTGLLWTVWIPSLLVALGGLWLFLSSVLRGAARYTVSAQRIEIERGLVSRRIENIELWRVRDVVLDQTLFDRLRGTGTITVFSSDQVEPAFAVRPVVGARGVFDQLRDAVAQARQAAGVMRVDR